MSGGAKFLPVILSFQTHAARRHALRRRLLDPRPDGPLPRRAQNRDAGLLRHRRLPAVVGAAAPRPHPGRGRQARRGRRVHRPPVHLLRGLRQRPDPHRLAACRPARPARRRRLRRGGGARADHHGRRRRPRLVHLRLPHGAGEPENPLADPALDLRRRPLLRRGGDADPGARRGRARRPRRSSPGVSRPWR